MHLSNGIDFRKNLKIGLSCPVHKKGCFRGQDQQNESAVHEIGCFRGWKSFNLLYLYDVDENTN